MTVGAAADAARLEEQFGCDGVGFEVLDGNHIACRIATPTAEGSVLLTGGHIWSWRPRDHHGVLFNSSRPIWHEGQRRTGGMPVCWPYLGRHPQDPDLPMHGPLRTLPWKVMNVQRVGDDATVTLAIDHQPVVSRLIPASFQVELQVTMGDALDVQMRTCNTGPDAYEVGGGLHTYLAVGDLRQTLLEVPAGAQYYVGDERDNWRAGDAAPWRLSGPLTRNYRDASAPGVVTLLDEAWQRRIRIHRRGSGSFVVWNPGSDAAAHMPGMRAADGDRFVCVEASNLWFDLRRIAPGQSHVLATRLEVDAF